MRILDLIDGFSSASAPTVGSIGAFSTAATQSIAAAGTITKATNALQFIRVQGSGAPRTASTTPFGSTAPTDGTVFIIMGADDTNTLTITNNDIAKGFLINGDIVLNAGSILAVIYLSTEDRYKQLFRLDY